MSGTFSDKCSGRIRSRWKKYFGSWHFLKVHSDEASNAAEYVAYNTEGPRVRAITLRKIRNFSNFLPGILCLWQITSRILPRLNTTWESFWSRIRIRPKMSDAKIFGHFKPFSDAGVPRGYPACLGSFYFRNILSIFFVFGSFIWNGFWFCLGSC